MFKSRKSQIILAAVIAMGCIGIMAGAALTYAFLRPPEEASAPISSIPIEITTENATEDTAEPTGELVDAPTDSQETSAENDEQPTQEQQEEGTGSAKQGVIIFEIVPTESAARFTINEILGGQPNTVVGSTDQVAGQIIINLGNPSASQVGTILVNARTLLTGKGNRDKAIKNQILLTNTYELITFTPTAVSGWPEQALVGETINLVIVGNLTLLDVTREVVFTMTVVAVSETRLEGIGSTTILYAEYGITIPEVPSVTSVEDEVLLEIEFVAVALE